MNVVFMGTPDFAEHSLQTLLDNGVSVKGVFTQPDRPKGRGMAFQESPVKRLAKQRNIPVFQPSGFSDCMSASVLKELSADLLVVVAYGIILPESFFSVPPLGAINLHGSLLPKYRGAAPIQRAILNGENETGVTVQYISSKMDAGDIIAQRAVKIGEFETSGELHDRLKRIGADLLLDSIRKIESGSNSRIPQDDSLASYAKMLDKSLSPINWNKTPREIVKHICGLDPWPVATMELCGSLLKVYGAEYSELQTDQKPGTVVSVEKDHLLFACADGATVKITEVQPAGKKRMSVAAYLLGHKVIPNG